MCCRKKTYKSVNIKKQVAWTRWKYIGQLMWFKSYNFFSDENEVFIVKKNRVYVWWRHGKKISSVPVLVQGWVFWLGDVHIYWNDLVLWKLLIAILMQKKYWKILDMISGLSLPSICHIMVLSMPQDMYLITILKKIFEEYCYLSTHRLQTVQKTAFLLRKCKCRF